MTNVLWQIPLGVAAIVLHTNGNLPTQEIQLTNSFSTNSVYVPAYQAPSIPDGTKFRLILVPSDFYFAWSNKPPRLEQLSKIAKTFPPLPPLPVSTNTTNILK